MEWVLSFPIFSLFLSFFFPMVLHFSPIVQMSNTTFAQHYLMLLEWSASNNHHKWKSRNELFFIVCALPLFSIYTFTKFANCQKSNIFLSFSMSALHVFYRKTSKRKNITEFYVMVKDQSDASTTKLEVIYCEREEWKTREKKCRESIVFQNNNRVLFFHPNPTIFTKPSTTQNENKSYKKNNNKRSIRQL